MAKSFVQLRSALDGIMEEKEAAIQKAAREIAVNLSAASGSKESKAETIENLLKGWSDADKFQIMKYAFVHMC